MKVKDFGQVFTPKAIVKDILDASDYKGKKILNKHVIDNSCGDGAFLVEILDRYITEYYKKYKTYRGLKKQIEKYIHGIEYDPEIWEACINNVNKKCKEYGIENVKFDILNDDALKIEKYNEKMDFVVGNPPYVRVHNLENQYESVKKYSFCESGMTDLYIVFYEIGLKMLNNTGILCYITPNSFYNSLAGNKLRKYIMENHNMELLMDLGHYQPFNVTTYTTICKICKNKKFKRCKYYKYNSESGKADYISNISYKKLFVDGNILLSENNSEYLEYLNYDINQYDKVVVKNGFATLNDKIFIKDKFDFQDNTINVIKASTGEWKKCIYPYDSEGKIIPFENLNSKLQKYLKKHKSSLEKDKKKIDSLWYAFGRNQAINDVKLNKISINTCVKDIDSIKINEVRANEGVYSGLYMLTKVPYEVIKEKICSQEFIEYLKLINKCKRGGYYTFSSKDLSKFINCSLEDSMMNNEEFLERIEKSFFKYLDTGSRSNEKLKILHGAIAKDLSKRLGSEYKIHSLGFGDNKEVCMMGRYMEKKVDIGIEKDGDIIAAIALKFIMRNYNQNSNNYFENMLGETSNIRSAGKPYFEIVILPSEVPYFNKEGVITHMETISEHNLSKYIKLSNDNTNDFLHTPNKTLIYLVDIPQKLDSVKNNKQYIKFYKTMTNFTVTPSKEKFNFGNTVIFNDYDAFANKVVHSILSI